MAGSQHKAYVVAVDMGYGHQRAAYPLLNIATTPPEWKLDRPIIIPADDYPDISIHDKIIWTSIRKTYEWFSRTNSIPLVGKYIFDILDYIQRIEPFYPKRDLSKPMLQTRRLYSTIKAGHGKHLIEMLNKNPIPFFTTFFVPAFFAEEHGYKGDIFCLCTDTDISRAWAPMYPKKSRIIYCAPNQRVKERLMLYGVLEDKIVLTGFPIPKEILGTKTRLEVTRASLARRIGKLDPKGTYREKYASLVSKHLGRKYPVVVGGGPITITFAVGGAGAQFKIGVLILRSLLQEIKSGKIKLNLVAGTSLKIYKGYQNTLKSLNIKDGAGVSLIYRHSKYDYFDAFNKVIIETDVLWTKPSELSFYAGAGLPIIIAPPLGSHEKYNRKWLLTNGAGIDQYDPRYTNKWFHDMLDEGVLAEAAMSGFLNAPKLGTFNIEDLIIKGKRSEISETHLL